MKEDFQNLIGRLENMILTGVFKPRERLVELHLSEKLGVSRFWIRDALKVLETKGLIKVIPYKGAVVCDIDENEIEDIFEVRIELDVLATRKAAQNVKKADINVLKRMAEQFEKSTKDKDFSHMISSNEDFHNYIYELSRNQTLVQMIRQLTTRGHILRYHAWSSPDVLKRIQTEHRLFIKGLKAQDLELLGNLAKRHLSYSKDSYLSHLKAKQANFLNTDGM